MKNKTLVCTLAILSMIAAMFLASPISAANSPKAEKFLIHIYSTDVAEFGAFESATGADALDFVDWPLPPDKVALYLTRPDIQLRDYSDVGLYEVDVNNQRWPTGVTEPRTLDPVTNTYKHHFGTNEPWDSKAVEFRKAISYLSNKGKWINEILKGYGHRLDTMVPIGALAGWTDYTDLNSKGYIYDYNPLTAASVLDAAGFTQGATANPYYDSGTPGSAQFLRTDPRYGGDLEPLQFYIRMDDILRRDLGRDLTAEIRKAGIQVASIETDKSVCYNQVMVIYDYHLYTGGWSVSVDVPNSLYGLFHSSQYWGGSSTSYFGGLGWSANYAGYVDDLYDTYSEQGKFGGSFAAVKVGGLLAQERAASQAFIIPGYDRAAVKAFKTGWEDVVNYRGFGPDTFYTFVQSNHTVGDTPLNPLDNEFDWGFKSLLQGPNPIWTQWVWDSWLCGLIYDSLIGRNPYDLSMEYGAAAESWEFNAAGSWARFTLRPGLTFHNGDPMTPEDIKFSLEFQRACGVGVCWGYDSVEPIIRVDTQLEDPTLGPRDAKVYFKTPSYWALHWAGFSYILNHNVWMEASADRGWGYVRGMTDQNDFTNRLLVRNYLMWEVDSDGDGDSDYQEDGSGPYVMGDWAPRPGPITAATSVALTAFDNYAIGTADIEAFTAWAFHMIGDADLSGAVDTLDALAIQRAIGTDSSMLPWGTGWDQYNPQTDINTGTWDMINHEEETVGDGVINYLDIGMWGLNYGGIP